MIRAVRVPVTIKMRTGFDEGDDERFYRIIRIASSCGVAAITVHGRTREQMYRGQANLETIRRAKEAASVPVIGNGDIRGGADAKRMFEATGCDGVMVARGALGNPWIYREIEQYLATGTLPPPPTRVERAAVLREHFAYQRELYGDALACRLIRRVIHWFVKGASGSAALREKGNRIESPEEFEALAAEFERSELEEAVGNV
jgi:tRNA-dihydrouridine synthase B